MAQFVSTRGAGAVDFGSVLINGLAPDGGLYSPDEFPDYQTLAGGMFEDVMEGLLRFFAPEWCRWADPGGLIRAAYEGFDGELARVETLGDDLALLDLTNGPSLAFKDYAMCLLAELMDYELGRRKSHGMVLCATSGDTGSAAISAFGTSDHIEVVVLFPKGRVSAVQQLQMTGQNFENVKVLEIEGTFDDAQAIVKRAFRAPDVTQRKNLIAVNSINFARIMAQCAYYVVGLDQMPSGGEVTVSVPTGNFGNALAAWYVKQMGAPIGKIVLATNSNDAYGSVMRAGEFFLSPAVSTLSPSMDIKVPSNFERIVWEYTNRDSAAVHQIYDTLATTGEARLSQEVVRRLNSDFVTVSVDDRSIGDTITETYRKFGRHIDPHTAVGIKAANEVGGDTPVLVCETASPAKFPDTVTRATGFVPKVDERLTRLNEKADCLATVSNSFQEVLEHL